MRKDSLSCMDPREVFVVQLLVNIPGIIDEGTSVSQGIIMMILYSYLIYGHGFHLFWKEFTFSINLNA